MTVKDRESFEKARAHAAAARQEFKAMCKVLLPEAFWQHAQESKVEAKAAVTAFRRAAKRQCVTLRKRPSRLWEKIEIA